MAHNIFGDRFIAYRQPAWHGLGEVFRDPIHSATEAMKMANADYEVAAARLAGGRWPTTTRIPERAPSQPWVAVR